jgi:ABC-type spermidine/putrescine transport system permease subunit II
MAVTLGSAATQSLQAFLYAGFATWFGTTAALWMVRGRVKPAR